jgi:predicted dinucleotide-binding enzyme
MEVTIIGTGNTARGIGSRVVAGGHDLTIVGKHSERAEAVAADIGGAGTVRTAVTGDPIPGEVVVLAVYCRDARAAVEQYPDQLAGKVVVDITNPANRTFDAPVVPPDASAAAELVALAGGARFVKSFNTTFPSPLGTGEVAGHKLDVLIAGDDAGAKGKVDPLTRGGALKPIDTGWCTRESSMPRVTAHSRTRFERASEAPSTSSRD